MATDAVVQRVIFQVTDNMGKTGHLALTIPTDSSTDPIETFSGFATVFNAVSDAIITGRVGETAAGADTSSAASNSYDARDKLAVEYVDSQNNKHLMHIPDPDPAIFLENNEQVDPANSLWLAAKSAIEGNVKDKLGNAVKVVRGFRTRSRRLKGDLRFL
jgi:hypothetical protein